MIQKALPEEHPGRDLGVLVFRSNGITFAAPMDGVAEIFEPQDLEEGISPNRISQWMPFPVEESHSQAGKILITKGEVPVAVLVDVVEDFLTLELESIQPLPPLIGNRLSPPWVWGGTLINNEIVLLVDFGALPAISKRGDERPQVRNPCSAKEKPIHD